jgi:hypothetical protein
MFCAGKLAWLLLAALGAPEPCVFAYIAIASYQHFSRLNATSCALQAPYIQQLAADWAPAAAHAAHLLPGCPRFSQLTSKHLNDVCIHSVF